MTPAPRVKPEYHPGADLRTPDIIGLLAWTGEAPVVRYRTWCPAGDRSAPRCSVYRRKGSTQSEARPTNQQGLASLAANSRRIFRACVGMQGCIGTSRLQRLAHGDDGPPSRREHRLSEPSIARLAVTSGDFQNHRTERTQLCQMSIRAAGSNRRPWRFRRGDFQRQGGAGPVRPNFSQDAGVLRLLDHREDHPRPGGRLLRICQNIEKAVAGQPDFSPCSSCTICAGCSSRSRGRPTFMYQGIFDTDFDKYTEDAVATFSAVRHSIPSSKTSKAFPKDWKTNAAGVHQVRPRASLPELPRIWRIPVRERRRDQEGAEAQGGVLEHARPDAVTSDTLRSRTKHDSQRRTE